MRGRRSLRVTSAARSTSDRLVPAATAATVPIEQGQITIPAVRWDPEAGSAPRSPSGNARTLGPAPAAARSASRLSMPHSSRRSRSPCVLAMSQTGTSCRANTSSRRTP
jgi:hypothetical protein